MRLVRAAENWEITNACPDDEATVAEAHRHGEYSVWAFTRADILRTAVRLPDTSDDRHLEELQDGWRDYLNSPANAWDRLAHEFMFQALTIKRSFSPRPILRQHEGFTRYILDGKHRLFAALENANSKLDDFELEVLWANSAQGRDDGHGRART